MNDYDDKNELTDEEKKELKEWLEYWGGNPPKIEIKIGKFIDVDEEQWGKTKQKLNALKQRRKDQEQS